MGVSIAIALLANAAPTIETVRSLTPEQAGELLLANHKHEQIEHVAEVAPTGAVPPGMTRVALVERSRSTTHGCIRKRWIGAFFKGAADRIEDSRLSGEFYAVTEVALPIMQDCSLGKFVHVNPNLDPDDALSALRWLDTVRAPGSRVKFRCRDELRTALCRNSKSIRTELAAISPWAVAQEGGNIKIWLGTEGQSVTEVQYAKSDSKTAVIARFIPPPF